MVARTVGPAPWAGQMRGLALPEPHREAENLAGVLIITW